MADDTTVVQQPAAPPTPAAAPTAAPTVDHEAAVDAWISTTFAGWPVHPEDVAKLKAAIKASPAADGIDNWFHDTFGNTEFSQDTLRWNTAYAAKQTLKDAIAD